MSNQSSKDNIIPSYAETLKEIGAELQRRKSVFLKRIVMLLWAPAVALIMLFIFAIKFQGWSSVDAFLEHQWIAYTSLALFVGTLCYYGVISFIFSIEKRLWIDAHFDEKHLDPKESWRIAKRLFIPALRLQLIAIAQYLFPALVVLAIVSFAYYYALTIPRFQNNDFVLILLAPISGVFAIYVFYLRIILRYVPFIFLDRIKTKSFSALGVLKEMRQLNNIAKKQTHVRTLTTYLSSIAATGGVSEVARYMQAGIGQNVHVSGKILGAFGRLFTEEVTKQTLSIAKIVTVYLLYKEVRRIAYGKEQEINEHIYKN